MIKTKVGLTTHHTNYYCGLELSKLVGEWEVIDLITQSTLGRKLNSSEKSIVHALAVAQCVADPHAWPLKIARCGAREGKIFKGLSSVLSYFEAAPIGPHQIRISAQFLQNWIDCEDRSAFLASLKNQKNIPGFGVFGRPADERVLAFKRWFDTHTSPRGRYFGAYQEIVDALEDRNENNTLISAALLLDLGFSPKDTEAMGFFFLLPPILANVLESSKAQNRELRNIPGPQIYFGPAARISPRKIAAQESERNNS